MIGETMSEVQMIVDSYTGEASPICSECDWIAWFIDRRAAARGLAEHGRECHPVPELRTKR